MLTTFAVRNAAGWSFGVVRYSGFAASAAVVTGIFCGELSLGTLEGAEILKEALVAAWSIVAWAKLASFGGGGESATAPKVTAPNEAGAAAVFILISRALVPNTIGIGSGRGTNTSSAHGRTSGAAPPRLGRAVESVSATFFQSSPVFCRTRP